MTGADPSTGAGEPERDGHLSAALRHAPDADLAPPARVSEAILRQAHEATQRSQPQRRPRAGFWAWLRQPAATGAFATLMLGVVIGLMWWDRPLQDALPERPPPAAPAVADGRTSPKAEATPSQAQAAPATASAAVAEPRPTVVAASRPAARPRAHRERSAPAPALASAPQSPLPSLPAPATMTYAEAPPAAAERAAVAAPPAPPAPAPAAMAPPATLGRMAKSDSASTRSPLTALTRAIAAEPERWTWQRDAAPAQPINAALQRWLAQAAAAAADARAGTATGDVSTPFTVITLMRDGLPQAALRLQGSGLRIDMDGGTPTVWQVELAADVAAALREALPPTPP